MFDKNIFLIILLCLKFEFAQKQEILIVGYKNE